ncbi:hypothetical protein GQ43DRAFT_416589 [Delitschia confertaspora ATCC 74209]|uniref:STEEP1 domain-containing protein n=1 Tax=Delitschia confertaspora ATCC 74209 TaxID=1513339 RepID=A0A9P4JPU9_9PLEO|nr:hypothetical protein GQ43DRAFT_416589 [Delitschia confertaspora ATCC 74209]
MASDGRLPASNREVHTYHCLCAHLVIATTTPLASLPCRKTSALDKSHILPLSTSPLSPSSAQHYGMLLHTTIDPKPQIIKSDQGFEKRYLQRCGRCNLVVGYQLDWQQFAGEKLGRRDDVLYLLPGGVMTTEEMAQGKRMDELIEFEGVTA